MNTIIGMIVTMMTAAMTMVSGATEANLPKGNVAGYYADCGVISEAVEETEEGFYEVVITMQNGNMFSFYSEDGDWMEGDLVSVIFYDNGTDAVADDEILSAKYSGWISEEEIQNWIK